MTILKVVFLTIMKKNYNYLTNSFLSSTPCDKYENISWLANYFTPFSNALTWIWKSKLTSSFSSLIFRNLVEFHNFITQQNNQTNSFQQFFKNWIWFNLTKFNWIEIPLKILTMLNRKEKDVVFSLIEFNLGIWIQSNFHSSCIMQIYLILNLSNGT